MPWYGPLLMTVTEKFRLPIVQLSRSTNRKSGFSSYSHIHESCTEISQCNLTLIPHTSTPHSTKSVFSTRYPIVFYPHLLSQAMYTIRNTKTG